MADMMNKWVLFLAVDGLEGGPFSALWQCFGDLNASTRIASFDADDEIKSSDGSIDTHSDMSFNMASTQRPDAIIIADGVTAGAIKNDSDTMALLKDMFNDNVAIATVGSGAKALIDAGIVDGMTVATSDDLKDSLEEAGAQFSDGPIAISNNIFSAKNDANMQMFCDVVSDYVTRLQDGFEEPAA